MTDARATGSWLVADESEEEEARAASASASASVSGEVQREVVPGFYAGTSKGAPPPMRNTRKVMVAVGGAAVVVAVIGGGVLALGGDDSGSQQAATPIADEEPAGPDDGATDPGADDGTSADDATAPPPVDAGDAPTDPAGDASGEGTDTPPAGDDTSGDDVEPVNAPPVRASEVVEVTDQGWYVAAGVGSYGFTVTNTSDRTLGSFVVAVKAYDRSGNVISGLDAWRHVIGTLQPYQELVVTDLLHSEAQAADGIGKMEFQVTELTTSDPGVRSPNDVPPGSVAVGEIEREENMVRTTVTYRVASTYEMPLDATVYLVFRNGAGHIVGGARSFIDLPAKGSVNGDFEVPTALVSPDATEVEVYVAPQLPL